MNKTMSLSFTKTDHLIPGVPNSLSSSDYVPENPAKVSCLLRQARCLWQVESACIYIYFFKE